MNYPITLTKESQGDWLKERDWQVIWPFEKSKEELREEIWQAIEQEIKDFTKSLIEAILENTIKEYLQLEKYQRSEKRRDYRNGYYPRRLQTKYGIIDPLRVPRLRKDQPEFQVFSRYQSRQPQIERLIGQLYLAGVSTRKLQGIVEELTGKVLSSGTISNIDKRIFQDTFARFQNSPLEDDIEYLILDGIRQPIRDIFGYQQKIGLVAYGIKKSGQRGIISLRIVDSEDEKNCLAFLTDLKQRGLLGRNLKLITVDGSPALIKAIKTIYPFKPIQRCWVHKMRNILKYLKNFQKKACLEGVKKIFNSQNKQEAIKRFLEWKNIWQIQAERGVRCLEEDLAELLTFYDFPQKDWTKIRSTNYLERVFREIRRRTRVITTFPNSGSAERIMVALSEAFLIKPTLPSKEFTQNS
jgi:transposase-like protein